MERLTKIDGCGQNDLIRCFDCGPEKAGENLENCGYCSEGWQRALNRLAAYKDTGLEPEDFEKAFNEGALLKLTAQHLGTTPDRLREWAQTDKEDRLVALPCKVGDTVWFVRPLDSKKEITETTIEKMVVKGSGVYMKLACNAMYETSCNSIGKTVFLTREEAEAALEGASE